MRGGVARRSAICSLLRNERGFLLVDFVLSLFVVALLTALVGCGLGRFAHGWQYLQEQLGLRQAGYYMQSRLEKDLGYSAVRITLATDGEISAATISGNKRLLFYQKQQGLYLNTSTGSGSGSNPLFIPDYPVSAWEVRRLDANRLYIAFTVSGSLCTRRFTQVIYCCNGVIDDA